MAAALPFAAEGDDEVELVVVDLGVARALWEGVPTARLGLDRDEHDLVDASERASDEGAAESLAVDDAVRRACGTFDEGLGRTDADRRARPLSRRACSPRSDVLSRASA